MNEQQNARDSSPGTLRKTPQGYEQKYGTRLLTWDRSGKYYGYWVAVSELDEEFHESADGENLSPLQMQQAQL
jgi:hypothetical protein